MELEPDAVQTDPVDPVQFDRIRFKTDPVDPVLNLVRIQCDPVEPVKFEGIEELKTLNEGRIEGFEWIESDWMKEELKVKWRKQMKNKGNEGSKRVKQ